MGAVALKQGNYGRAAKLFKKSLGMYPLPGVEALLGQAEGKMNGGSSNGSSGSAAGNGASSSTRGGTPPSSSRRSMPRTASTASMSSTTTAATGADGRTYTQDQIDIVKKVLRSKPVSYTHLTLPTIYSV